jgi:quinol monooxygenase YgiN
LNKQLELVFALKLVEKEKLQQPMSNGKEFFQELFEGLHHYSLMPKIKNENHKYKNNAHVEEHVEKPIIKQCLRRRRAR